MKCMYHIFTFSLAVLMVLLLGVTDIYAAACISGFVKDKAGNPVVGGDLDLYNAISGVKQLTPGDNTDVNGFYSICVLPGIYNVTYSPPDSSHLLGKKIFTVDLSNNQAQAINVTLDSGLSISGRITDPAGQPVLDVDMDVDSIAGGRVFTPNDNSAIPSGAYWIVVPPGLFRLRWDSPVGSRLRGVEIDSVTITGDTIIDIVLPEGWLLTGRVTDESGIELNQVEVGLRDALTGEKLFVSHKDTDTAGDYSIAVPTGLFELRFAGAPGSGIIGVRNDSVDISTDLVWNQVMTSGIVLAVQVRDELGRPIVGADIDVKLSLTGAKLFTPNDRTDATGLAEVAVPVGNYQLEVDPPLGSSFDRMILTNLELTGDTSITIILPSVTRLLLTGRVIDNSLSGISGVEFDFFSHITGQKVFLVENQTDSLGEFTLAVPEGEYDITIAPPVGSRLVGKRITNLSLTMDTRLEDILLLEGLLISVQVIDRESFPVAGVDLDLVNRANQVELFTPRDNTDENGLAEVLVHSGTYSIKLEPPVESGLSTLTVDNISLTEDTLLTFLLGVGSAGNVSANFELGQNYPNPFNATTIIPVTLVTGSNIKVEIYNALGQKVKTVDNRHREAGVHHLRWDCHDNSGETVSSGIYFYRVQTPLGSDTRQMILIR